MPKFSSESRRLDPLVWKITAVAILGSFLAQLDATIVNVSLSSLAVDLHSSLGDSTSPAAIFWHSLLCSRSTAGWWSALEPKLSTSGAFRPSRSPPPYAVLAVGERVDRISRPPGHERRPDSSDDADDDGACCRQAYGARHGVRGCAHPDRADPWPGHRRHRSAAPRRWLFLVNVPVGVLAIVLAILFLPIAKRRSQRTRSSWLRPALSGARALPVRIGSSGRAHWSCDSSDFHRSACGLLQDGDSQGGQGAHRSSAVQEKDVLCVRHHAVHGEPEWPTPSFYFRSISSAPVDGHRVRRAGFAGSAWNGDDLFLSMDRSPDAAVRGGGYRLEAHFWPSQQRCHLSGWPITDLSSPCSQVLSLCVGWASARSASPPQSRLHIASVKKTGPANGDNLAQYCAASRRADSDYPLRNLSGMAVGNGTVQRWPLRRIYRSLCSSPADSHAPCFATALRLPFFHR